MTATALPDNLNSNQSSHTVDTTAPTITRFAFTSTGPYGVGSVITLQATFSESVTIAIGTAAAIPLTIGSTTHNATAATNSTASTTHNFTYTVAGTDSDTNGISVATSAVISNPGRIEDTAGNTMTATALPDNLNSNQSSHTVDTTAPTITRFAFTSTGPYGVGSIITLQATFSESVTIASGTAAAIPLTIGSTTRNATAASTSTVSTTHNFTYTVASTDSDTNGLSIASSAVLANPARISDAAGNAATTALPDTLTNNQSGHTADTTAPTITRFAFTSTGPYGVGSVISLQATFSESVTLSTGTAASIPLTIGSTTRNATAATTATASTTHNFTYTVASTDSDSNGLSVATAATISNPGRIADAAGNTMTATALPDNLNSNQSGHTVDTTAPTVSRFSFSSSGPYKSGAVITLQATFSESVTIATGTAAAIPLTIGNTTRNATAAATRTASTTHNFTYTVAANDNDSDGISIASSAVLTNPARIIDAAGNAITATALPDTLNSNQSSHTVDNTAPTLQSLRLSSTPGGSNNHYISGNTITVQATFSEAVTINTTSGTPTIPLTIGSNTRNASTTAGTGTTHNFSYTVVANDLDTDGISIEGNSLNLNGGTMTDAAANTATINHTALPTQAGHKVDAIAPTITAINAPANVAIAAGRYTLTVTFSEAITGFATSDITIGGTAPRPTIGSPTKGTGNSYTIPVTLAANGNNNNETIILSVSTNAVSDNAGNSNTAASSTFTSTLQAAPGVTITAPPTANAAYPLSITFTEPVTGFTASDLTVSNGTATLTGSGASYTATVTPTADGTVTAHIAAGAATGVNTQQSSTESNTSRTAYDTTAPTIAISGVPEWRNNYTTFTATFTFSEAVTGFEASDIQVTGGTASNFNANSRRVYTAGITPDNGTTRVEVAIAQNAAQDTAGNNNRAAESRTTTIDTTAPTVNIEAPGIVPNVASNRYTITVTFSEPVSGFTAAAITLGGTATHKPTVGTPAPITTGTAANRSYTVPITQASTANTNNQTISYTIAAGSITDRAGNNNRENSTTSTLKDAPGITISGAPATANAPYPLTITFTEPVSGFEASDLTVTNGTATLTGSGASYTATITPTADGTVTVHIAAGIATGTSSERGNLASATLSSRYDSTAPTVTISGVPAVQNNRNAFTATVTFSEAVTGFEAADIRVTGGTASNFTETTSGTVWTATITPAANASRVQVAINAAAARDAAGNGNTAATASMNYDGTPPTVRIDVPERTDGTAFTARFIFSEAVTGFAATDIRVSNGSASGVSGSGANYTATITPAANSRELRIMVPANAVHDLAGNANEAATPVQVQLLSIESPERQQAAHKSILPELTQAVVSNITGAVTERIETAVSNTSNLTIGGNNFDIPGLKAGGVQQFMSDTLPQLIANNEQVLQNRKLDAKQLLAGTSFALPLAANGEGEATSGLASITFWGGGSYRHIKSDDDNSVDWNGAVVSASLGLDIRPTPGLLTGIAITRSNAKLDYRDNEVQTAGRYDYNLTSLSPYLGWNASETVDIWLAAGFGDGETTLLNADNGARINNSDVSVQNLSGGLKLHLLGDNSGKLSLLSDIAHSQTELDNDGSGQSLKLNKQRARLNLQAEQTLTLNSGTFTPSAQVGARYDGGDGNTGTGIEVGAGFTAAFSNGFQVSFNTRGLLESSANYRDLELNGSLRYTPRSKQGWSFSFEPRYGELNTGGIEQLWQQGIQTPEATETTDASLFWRSELGYGLRPRHGRQWHYYGGMQANHNRSQVHLGSRLQWTDAIRLELEIRRREEDQRNNAESEFLLKGQFNF